MESDPRALRILALNTIAFTVCFAVWTMYGVLVTFLVDHGYLQIDKAQMGWLIGIPILTGSVMRLPLGLLTDRLGGKPVFIGVMVFAALSLFFTSQVSTFGGFLLGGLLFGVSGASFAVGIAYSSVFFPRERQGTALGVFGVGNAGAALTTLLAPTLLKRFTDGGENIEGWRTLPILYGFVLLAMAGLFLLLTVNRTPPKASHKTLRKMLAPLRDVRVWRFGLYYFLVFGGFVALAQWLVPYYLNVYAMPLATAGVLASAFSLPSGATRALGGWISDRFGARATMYWVLTGCAVSYLLLVAPRMEIRSPGEGVMADKAGVVTAVTDTYIEVDSTRYAIRPEKALDARSLEQGVFVFPVIRSWQEPAVRPGDHVTKRQVIARGVTTAYFQANVWIFTGIVLIAGLMMGIGMAAVFKHIAEYFPADVGVVGGLVGVIGGLGGFVCPILFGFMLNRIGLWTSCWVFLLVVTLLCLLWMHIVILRMTKGKISEK
ncbi:MAG: MFS transporter [Armatimonadota bacterium]